MSIERNSKIKGISRCSFKITYISVDVLAR